MGRHEGQLSVFFEGLQPRAAALAGEATAMPWGSDWYEKPRTEVDLLFVIDNGVSMEGVRDAVEANLRPLLSRLMTPAVDLHVAVTTTGLEPGGDCPGGVGGGEDGRFFPVDGSSPRILDETVEDLEEVWAAALDVGACRTGSNMVFEAALRALTPPLVDAEDDPRHPEPNDGNAGFFRPDAYLAVVAVTDRDDESPEREGYYLSAMAALKDDGTLVSFSAVAGDPVAGCSGPGGTATPGDRLEWLASRTGGGVFQSICEETWHEFDHRFSGGTSGPAFGFLECYRLTEPPADLNGDGQIRDEDGELQLLVDGEEVPSRNANGVSIWHYRPDWEDVCFQPLASPPPGATIEIRYPLGCP